MDLLSAKGLKSLSFLFFFFVLSISHKNVPRQKSCVRSLKSTDSFGKLLHKPLHGLVKPWLAHKGTRAVHCSAAQPGAALAAWSLPSQAIGVFNFLHKRLYV